MNEEKKALSDEDLEQVTGGGNGDNLPWGPFNDCVVNCPNCNALQIIYKDQFPWHCNNCTATMWF